MGRAQQQHITPAALEAYLSRQGFDQAKVLQMTPLGQETQEELKNYGYGRPLHIIFECQGQHEHVVLRTMSADPFGHDRRADRAGTLLLSQDTFASIPQHIKPLDCGVFDGQGTMTSVPVGEFFLLTNFVPGNLYAGDLSALQPQSHASQQDRARAETLASYLADLHSERRSAVQYQRALRDTVGSGEGIFGILDTFVPCEKVPIQRLTAIESQCVQWRWRLRHFAALRARRTHGDFHPFNLLFREQTEFCVLDCSRGGAGDPADDVACLSINYLFFALCQQGWKGALQEIWHVFWQCYLTASQDHDILTVVPLYFAWRALVLASPVWYANINADVRDTLLRFAERLLDGAAFLPNDISKLIA